MTNLISSCPPDVKTPSYSVTAFKLGYEVSMEYIKKHKEWVAELDAKVGEVAPFLGENRVGGTHKIVAVIELDPKSDVTADNILTVNAAMTQGGRYNNVVEPTKTYSVGMIGLGLDGDGPQCVVVCVPGSYEGRPFHPYLERLNGGIWALKGVSML